MSDRDERQPKFKGRGEPGPTLPDPGPEVPDPELLDPLPPELDAERGFDVDPTEGAGMRRTSDDDDLNAMGGGVSETPLRPEYESVALRTDLARRLEDVVATAQDWAREEGSDSAHAIAEALLDIYELLGEPIEDSDEGPDIE